MTSRAPLAVILFEDDAVAALGPIVHTRPAFELRVGAFDLRERVELACPHSTLHATVRSELEPLLDTVALAAPPDHGEVVLINARTLAAVEDLASLVDALDPDSGVHDGGAWIAVRIAAVAVTSFLDGDDAKVRRLGVPSGVGLVGRPWEIVARNDDLLVRDHATLARTDGPVRRIFGVRFAERSRRTGALLDRHFGVPRTDTFAGALLIEPGRILVGTHAVVRPGAVIDAAAGPVILGAGVVVHPLSVIVGPAYLGPGTVVNPGAKLREGTSIGAWCKVGGEIEESVILDLSNKQHDGFLGHALLGSWVNLGADTNGSDLKNNYGSVRVDLGDGAVDSGESFVGQHLADHVKTGIDTMLTTGGVVGVGANVFGGGFVPRFVPAFAWGGPEGLVSYRLEAALETARAVFARRDVVWDARHEALLHHVHAATASQRQLLGLE